MKHGWRLAAAGLAVTAIAGCSASGMHASAAAHGHSAPATVAAVAAAPKVPQVQQAHLAATVGTQGAGTGQAAFRHWWAAGGYRQYQAVASDLSRLIITDSMRDQDNTFTADAKRLTADAAAAARHLPPVDRAGYRAGMRGLAQAGRDALAGSYDKAFTDVRAALPKLAAFNTAISGWDTTAPTA